MCLNIVCVFFYIPVHLIFYEVASGLPGLNASSRAAKMKALMRGEYIFRINKLILFHD